MSWILTGNHNIIIAASVIMRVAKQYDISPDLRTKLAEMMVSSSSVQDVRVCREFLLSNNK